jgi:pimeloyl-ACP methyl ester carboxylesterase
MGAQIALDYASQYAAQKECMLEGLILIDPIFPQALDGVLKTIAHFRPLIKALGWLIRVGYAMGIHRRHYPQRDLQRLDQETRAFLAANPDKRIADLYMNPLADLPYIPLANYLQDLYEVTRPLLSIEHINVPVLVLLSEGASTSHAEINKKLLSALPNLQIKTIDADHWLLTEKPVEARETIENWCKQQLKL